MGKHFFFIGFILLIVSCAPKASEEAPKSDSTVVTVDTATIDTTVYNQNKSNSDNGWLIGEWEVQTDVGLASLNILNSSEATYLGDNGTYKIEDGVLKLECFRDKDIVTTFNLNYSDQTIELGGGYVLRKKTQKSVNAINESVSQETTPVVGTLIDNDGHTYNYRKIGTQVWMTENLRTSKYRNGERISNLTSAADWSAATLGAWCYYNNDATLGRKYGKLYNWYAVADNRNIAPVGWHVATDEEWTTLENYLIANGYNYDGSTSGDNYAKSLAATTDWATDSGTGTIGNDLTKNNRSGFSALPGGNRYTSNGTFGLVGGSGYWWSSTEKSTSIAWDRLMGYGLSDVYRDSSNKQNGFSVRCVRDSQ